MTALQARAKAPSGAARLAPLMAVVGMLIVVPSTIAAKSAPAPVRSSYLEKADLGYVVPPAPDNQSPVGEMDLAAVRAAQGADLAARQQATEDAAAYNYDQLMVRFSAAVGTQFSLHSRPILAHILNWVLADTGYYAGQAKGQKDRERPYVEDPSTIPCETDYLYSSNKQSYPSGHSTNGYAAALVMAAVIPGRKQALLARGIRYGDNRVVCGVHHPTDVDQGRRLAIAYFAKVQGDNQFKRDLACAVEEHEQSIAKRLAKAPAAYSPDCQILFDRYKIEAIKRIAATDAAAASFDPQ